MVGSRYRETNLIGNVAVVYLLPQSLASVVRMLLRTTMGISNHHFDWQRSVESDLISLRVLMLLERCSAFVCCEVARGRFSRDKIVHGMCCVHHQAARTTSSWWTGKVSHRWTLRHRKHRSKVRNWMIVKHATFCPQNIPATFWRLERSLWLWFLTGEKHGKHIRIVSFSFYEIWFYGSRSTDSHLDLHM